MNQIHDIRFAVVGLGSNRILPHRIERLGCLRSFAIVDGTGHRLQAITLNGRVYSLGCLGRLVIFTLNLIRLPKSFIGLNKRISKDCHKLRALGLTDGGFTALSIIAGIIGHAGFPRLGTLDLINKHHASSLLSLARISSNACGNAPLNLDIGLSASDHRGSTFLDLLA